MRHLTLTLLATAALAVAPTAASAQSGAQIPEPGPILTHIGKTPRVELWDGGGGLPYLGAANSYNAGDWEHALRRYHDDGVYEKQIAKVDAVAAKWLRRGKAKRVRVRGKPLHLPAARRHRSARKTAIVFDVDETALSNYSAIDADNFTFGTNSQQEAQNEVGTAIKPSLALYQLARRRGVATFFITGRRESTRAHTDSNLKREGFTSYTRLVLKPEAFTGSTVDYKAGARKAIEDEGYRIVASVGDQYSDLAGGHEDVAFKLPNPFYFLP